MVKRLLEDMVRSNPRIKENVLIKNGRKERVEKIQEVVKIKEEKKEYKKNKPRYFLWFIALISVVFCFFAFSFLFEKAEITVNPKTQDLVLNENLSANRDSSAKGLLFNLVIIPGEENKTIQASGEKDTAINAIGSIIIFNSFNSSPQILSAGTKLEASNGKIYKTQEKVVVPGKGKDGTSGQAEVKISASVAGAEYNSPALDFKIASFKGTSKYLKFVGRSKPGTTINGGFKGKVPDVSDGDKVLAIASLKNTLQSKLLQKAIDQIPAGLILFKDAVFLNTDESSVLTTYNKDNSLTLTMKGTLFGLLLNEQQLTKKIAGDNIDKYDGSDVYISNIKDLKFSLSTQVDVASKENITFNNLMNINFNLSGSAKIVFKLDVNKFSLDLLGKSKSNFNKTLLQYPNIDSAILKINPIWMMSIPDKIKDIKIIVNYPQS